LSGARFSNLSLVAKTCIFAFETPDFHLASQECKHPFEKNLSARAQKEVSNTTAAIMAATANTQESVAAAGAASDGAADLDPGFFLPGAIIMTICRPSSLGNCSTTIKSANSSLIRANKAKPSSW
jgi:hypothetical protein